VYNTRQNLIFSSDCFHKSGIKYKTLIDNCLCTVLAESLNSIRVFQGHL